MIQEDLRNIKYLKNGLLLKVGVKFLQDVLKLIQLL